MNPILHTLGWTLLHFLWEGLVLGLLAWGALALMQRRSAGSRYAVALLFFGVMTLAPIATFLLVRLATAPLGAVSGSAAVGVGASIGAPWNLRLEALLEPGLPWVLAVWGLGVLLLSARLAGGLFYLQRLTSVGVEPAPAEWHLVLARLARELGLRRVVRLLRSARVEAPMVVGWLRPVILVPAAAFSGLSPLQVEAILAHEMAHIRRLDFLVNLVQSLVETLLFFHPAVWWLSSRLRAERELCCDDTAVAVCGDHAAYARALAALESFREPSPVELDAKLGVGAHGGSLMIRIRRLLQPQLLPNPRFRTAAFALAAAGLLAGTIVQQPKASSSSAHEKHAWNQDSEGDVKLDPDAKDPVVVGKNGSFKLKTTAGDLTRSYEVTAKDGAIYKVNGVQQPLDESGRAWLRSSVRRAQRDQAMGALKNRMRADQVRMQAEQARADAERIRIEEMPEVVTTETRDGKQHVIVRKQGKVISEDELPDPPEVSIVENAEVTTVPGGSGRKHLIIKKDGKVVEDRIIEIPEVTTVVKHGKTHLIVKKNGKVTEDQVLESPDQWSFDWDEKGGSREAEIQRLQARIEALQAQLNALQGHAVPPAPPAPPAPPTPEVAPAPPAPPVPPPPPAPPED